jgi:hypothetical protein
LYKIKSAIKNDIKVFDVSELASLDSLDSDPISLDDIDDDFSFETKTEDKKEDISTPLDIVNEDDEWEWEYVDDDSNSDEWEWEYVEDDTDSDDWEWEYVEDDTPNKDKILEKLDSIIKKCQKQGLINMRLNPLYKNHNMWIAIKLFKEFGIVHWNEFLYTLHCLEIGETEEYAYKKIREDRKKIDNIIFLNEKGENLPDTCYSYIRSYLVEAGLITRITNMEYRVLDSFDNFVSKLNI